MLRPVEILVNSFAQDKLEFNKLIDWFDSLTAKDRRKTLISTRTFLEQSHPDQALINIGIEQIPLKPSMTPIVLLKTNSLKIALNKIVELPDDEMRKAFISLCALFKVSDKQRRNVLCAGKCGHEWHNLDRFNIELTEEYLNSLKGKIE